MSSIENREFVGRHLAGKDFSFKLDAKLNLFKLHLYEGLRCEAKRRYPQDGCNFSHVREFTPSFWKSRRTLSLAKSPSLFGTAAQTTSNRLNSASLD